VGRVMRDGAARNQADVALRGHATDDATRETPPTLLSLPAVGQEHAAWWWSCPRVRHCRSRIGSGLESDAGFRHPPNRVAVTVVRAAVAVSKPPRCSARERPVATIIPPPV